MLKPHNYFDLYINRYKTKEFINLYEKLQNKQNILLAPYVLCIIEEINEKYGVFNNFIETKKIINIACTHFENYWKTKLIRVFAVELTLFSENFCCEINDRTPFIDLFIIEEYRASFIERYPVLIRLAEVYSKNYLNYLKRLLKRTKADLNGLQSKFLNSKDNWFLDGIELVGDSHNSGETVSILTFIDDSTRRKIVYKPYRIDNLACLEEILIFFDSKLNFGFFSPSVLNKTSYGWVEYINNESCDQPTDLQTFYYRFGILIGICNLLQGFDLHYQNIIAMKSYPVIIDCECFYTPEINFSEKKTADIFRELNYMSYALLIPNIADGKDICALTGLERYHNKTEVKLPQVFTQFLYEINNRKPFDFKNLNKPHINEAHSDPFLFFDHLKRGLHDIYYHFIQEKQSIYKSMIAILDKYEINTRVVIKPTEYYADFLEEMFHPKLLKSEKLFNEYLNKVVSSYSKYSVTFSEINQLKNLDVPIFYACNKLGGIKDHKNSYKAHFYRTYKDNLNKFISHVLDEHFVKEQLMILDQAFEIRNINKHCHHLSVNLKKNTASYSNENILAFLQSYCIETLDEIIESVLRVKDQVLWCKIFKEKVFSENVAYKLGFTEDDLYSGASGILITFIYAYEIFKLPRYYDFILLLIKSIKINSQNFFRKDISLFSGLGQYLYLLIKLETGQQSYSWSFDDPLFRSINKNIDAYMENDVTLDIISGTSGFLLIVSKHYHYFKNKVSFTTLKKCAYHILNSFDLYSSKNPTLAYPGVSHGVSGLIWTLFYANKILRDPFIEDSIQKLLQLERTKFDKQKGNWISWNQENHKNSEFDWHWCYGFLGILLTRIDMFKHGYYDSMIEGEIALANAHENSDKLSNLLNLCHGHLAYSDLYLQMLDIGVDSKDKLESYLNKLYKQLINKNECLDSQSSKITDPALMTGRAGLAYQLMRICNPKIIPSILLFE